MTFTTGFFGGWALIGVDALLLACLLVLALLLQPILLGGRDWKLLRWWGTAAGVILAWDVLDLFLAPETLDDFWLGIVSIFLFVTLLAILAATTIAVNPWQMLTRAGRKRYPAAWARFLPA